MAVDAPVLISGWWVYLRSGLGSTHLNPSAEQINNAYRVRTGLQQQGYNEISIAGVLGNMQVESGLSAGCLQNIGAHLAHLPHQGEHLADLTNLVIQQYWCSSNNYGYGTGLIQWDIRGNTNKIADFAIANNSLWYSGTLQLYKLDTEFQHDNNNPEDPWFWFGDYHETWAEFKQYTGTPENAADIFRVNRERGGNDSIQQRKDNARYWYDYFIANPNPPVEPWLLMCFNNKRKEVLKNVRKYI